ncbi:MAG: DUF1552 domain-containing protein [Archangiaceae bacterium]|nr:DUF1552 domain-containing protein [Archangiaceae bacterium]
MNRRFFLKGLGGAALTLPALTSLLPNRAHALGAPPRRYVQLMNPYGPTAATFYGGLTGATQAAANVRTRALSSVSGALSPILGNAFDAVRSKVSVLRGFEVPVNNPNHQYCFTTTASGYAPGLDGDGYPPQAGNESIDVVLSKSAKVYAAPQPSARRLVNINPLTSDDYSGNRSFSWQRNASNNLQMLSPLKSTSSLLGVFMSSFGVANMPSTDAREVSLVQAVHADYLRVRAGPRISVDDKRRLDAYLALIDDLERDVKATQMMPSVCAAPGAEPGNGADALVRTQLRVLAAAMACDLTRVGSVMLGMSAGYDTRHTEHHAMNGTNVAGGMMADLRGFAANVGWFCSFLDGISDTSGTLLDNSIVYWSMQYGCGNSADSHTPKDMPIVVGGRGGGALAAGNFIDFSANGVGMPLNNLLVTLFNAMGLSSTDYERAGSAGFGLYTGNTMAGRADQAMWTATAGRRTALPVFYTGPALG